MTYMYKLFYLMLAFLSAFNFANGKHHSHYGSRRISRQYNVPFNNFETDFMKDPDSLPDWVNRRTSFYKNLYDDSTDFDCKAAAPYYRDEDPMIELVSGILTDWETFICVGKALGTPYLAECPILPNHGQFYEHPFRIKIVKIRPWIVDDCVILDVIINIRPDYPEEPSDIYQDCYLVLINGALDISCPPDHFDDKYKIVSLFPVKWDDAHLWHHTIPRGVGYIVCGERDADQCDTPALFSIVRKDKFLESRHVVIFQESSKRQVGNKVISRKMQ